MQDSTRRTALLVTVLLSSALLVLVGGMPAAAQDNNTTNISDVAPYYANNTSDVANESWMHGHEAPTLANFSHYLTRVGGFIVGNGGQAQGGGSMQGLILGLIIMASFVGIAVGPGVGGVGGAVLAVIGVAGLVSAALVPGWLYPVVLFVVGAILAVVVIRAYR